LQTVGTFKGIIEVESRDDKAAYTERKTELIKELIESLKKISKNSKEY